MQPSLRARIRTAPLLPEYRPRMMRPVNPPVGPRLDRSILPAPDRDAAHALALHRGVPAQRPPARSGAALYCARAAGLPRRAAEPGRVFPPDPAVLAGPGNTAPADFLAALRPRAARHFLHARAVPAEPNRPV